MVFLVRRDAAAFFYTFASRALTFQVRFMEVTCTERSVQGPVRQNNEDRTAFFQPDSLEERRSRGIVALLADGVGGEDRGEVASRLAVETALKIFREAAPETAPAKLLGQMFNAANLAVYDAAHQNPSQGNGAMSTT
ncbi:MAG: protein phosphatase 2C domain-containing protein, partial [Alphaproteobacteria bacterium]|nr:protein phosphatase 2C domain-containing protein [Alphaproteobacteria bacterium]